VCVFCPETALPHTTHGFIEISTERIGGNQSLRTSRAVVKRISTTVVYGSVVHADEHPSPLIVLPSSRS
jgi:hypothetical protein